MAFWNRKSERKPRSVTAQLQLQRAKIENRKLEIVNKALESTSAQMRSFRSFPDEFYTTGTKQGQYAGLLVNNNSTARRNSRIVHNISPIATSIEKTISTLTVGSGLQPEAQPLWLLIPGSESMTDEEKSDWAKLVEAKYGLWAKKKTTSYNQSMNRYEQEQEIFKDLLIDGEYFEIYRYATNAKRNPMTIQLIKPEDVRNASGSKVAAGNAEQDGIEYDKKNIPVAYHILDHATNRTVRVLRVGPRSGRVFVNHVKLGGKRRGTGILAPMVTELMKLGDYEVLELQAAVINAMYAIWVQTPAGEDGLPSINAGIGSPQQSSTETISGEQWLKDRKEVSYNEGGLQIDTLPGGMEVKSFDTKRPNVNFGNFLDAVKKNLASSVNMPISVIDKQFQNNYSASRGELILAWYEIEKYRFNQSMTNDLVYRMWLWGEILNASVEAEGFFRTEEIQDAWANAKWIGNQRPDIDPLRSVKAHVEEHNRGYRTGKAITAERGGGDYDENLPRVKKELEQVAEMQAPFLNVDVDILDQ